MISGENLFELALPCKSEPLHIELDLANVTDLFGLRLLAVEALVKGVVIRGTPRAQDGSVTRS